MKKLQEIPGKNPFKVPDNYFEELNRKIISRATGSEKEVSGRGILAGLKPYLAVAASIAAVLLISYATLKTIKPGDKNDDYLISSQELNEYYINDIDVLTLEEQAQTFIPEVSIRDMLTEVNISEIAEYLLLQNIDENEIYELF